MTKKIKKCEKFSIGEDGFCINYTGEKEKKAACRYYCKVFNTNIKDDIQSRLEGQIIGLELEYET